MSITPLTTLSLATILAFSPFGGCDGAGAANPASRGPEVTGAPAPSSPSDDHGGGSLSSPSPNALGGHGGTPEPATMLVLGSTAAGYLALRRRRRATTSPVVERID